MPKEKMLEQQIFYLWFDEANNLRLSSQPGYKKAEWIEEKENSIYTHMDIKTAKNRKTIIKIDEGSMKNWEFSFGPDAGHNERGANACVFEKKAKKFFPIDDMNSSKTEFSFIYRGETKKPNQADRYKYDIYIQNTYQPEYATKIIIDPIIRNDGGDAGGGN